MSDARTRALERAAQDDPSAAAALLVARLRRGDLTQERLELAAYAGDPGARRALGRCCHKHDAFKAHGMGHPDAGHCAEDPFPAWLTNLSALDREADVRAALAAARACEVPWAGRVIGAEGYTGERVGRDSRPPGRRARPWRAILGNGHERRTAAIQVAGEPAVRHAIRSALVSWALGGGS